MGFRQGSGFVRVALLQKEKSTGTRGSALDLMGWLILNADSSAESTLVCSSIQIFFAIVKNEGRLTAGPRGHRSPKQTRFLSGLNQVGMDIRFKLRARNRMPAGQRSARRQI